MKLTSKQKKDLETIMFFIPTSFKDIEISNDDIEKFFEYSDEGKHKEEIKKIPHTGIRTGLGALLQGKRWRGINMKMYEEGIDDGSVPYIALLEGMPISVVEFISKEMFKGSHKEKIEQVYNLIHSNYER